MPGEEESPRRRAEALHAAGLLPPVREELPPERQRNCHGCGYRMDPVLIEQGETLHPCCEPPRRERVRRRK